VTTKMAADFDPEDKNRWVIMCYLVCLLLK